MKSLWDHDCFKIIPRECSFSFTRSDMMSRAVSDPTQKNGGDSHHPICNAVGTTRSASPSDTGLMSAAGRTQYKFQAFRCESNRRQKPSEMSSLENRKGKSRL